MSTPAGRLVVVLFLTVIFGQASPSAQSGVLIVSNTQDAGNESLRDTIAAAATGDTIEFNIPASDPGYDPLTGVFTITLTGGEIVIARDLNITNASTAKIAISGNHDHRIFSITTGTVAIFNLSLISGAAIGADGNPGNDDEAANGRPGIGGAVQNQGTLTFTRCSFTGNTAIGGTGATRFVLSGGRGGDAQGGAIANQNMLSLVACTLADNSLRGGMPGIGGFEIKFSAAGGVGSGGAVYNDFTGTVSLTNCTVAGNNAVGGDVIWTPPFGHPGADVHGGGIANLGTLTILHSTVANNTATGGASLPMGNPGYQGGASFGGGLDGAGFSYVSDTIFARNAAVGGPPMPGAVTGPDVSGEVSSQGHNLLGRSDGCTGFTSDDQQGGTTNDTSLDPMLGPLGNHGGLTQTLPLLPSSPAIDRGDPTESTRDQRYFVRTGPPDVGAFEYQGTQPVLLANISTRVRVGAGDSAMIGGFIITGTEPKTVIVRGIGPSLPVPGALSDTIIDVYGPSGEFLAFNDDWSDAGTRGEIIGSGLAPASDLESALWGIINPGAYTVVVRGKNAESGIALFEVYDLDQTVESKLSNVSTRGFVEIGDDVMIGGTIIVGSAPRVLFRAIGPSLTDAGVPDALGNPIMELYNGNGELIAVNDDWRDDQEAEIFATGIPPSNDLESAIVRNLAPGPYTAVVRGKNSTAGVALIEVYDLN